MICAGKMGEKKGVTPLRARTAWGLGEQAGAFWVREDISVGWVKKQRGNLSAWIF